MGLSCLSLGFLVFHLATSSWMPFEIEQDNYKFVSYFKTSIAIHLMK